MGSPFTCTATLATLAAGYMFGLWFGFLFAYAGCCLGTAAHLVWSASLSGADRKSCDCAPCVGAVIAFVLGRTLFRSWVSSLARQYPKVALMDQVPDSRLVDQQRDLEGTQPPRPGLSRLSVPRRVREGHREEGGWLEDSASSTPLAHAPLQR